MVGEADIKKIEGVRVIGTYSCNMSCPFCYQTTRQSKFLDARRLRYILLSLKEDFKKVPIYFTFQGGELSLYPDRAEELFKAAHEIFPQVYSKSLTTNGTGNFDWYLSLQNFGITHFTVSVHEYSEQRMNLIGKLAQQAFCSIRVNCYLDENNIDNVKGVFNICCNNRIPLTICEDLTHKGKDVEQLIDKICFSQSVQWEKIHYKHQLIYSNYLLNYTFWLYFHQDHYDYNNLIILPNGDVTVMFDDVISGKGSK